MTSIWMPPVRISSPERLRKESQKILKGPLFRFVILHHTGWTSSKKPDHWDWMLEPPLHDREGLISFAVFSDPRTFWMDEPLEPKPRHRRDFLDYEGPISQDRGHVKRVACGSIRWLDSNPVLQCFELVHMEFLDPPFASWPTGRYCLLCTPSSPSPSWRLVRERGTE
jgi:hypothetical protein